MKKLVIGLIILAAMSVIVVPRVMNKLNENVDISVQETYLTVEGEAVKKGTIADYAILTGTISSQKIVQILPTMPAKVEEINVEVGDRVEEGDILFVLDKTGIKSQVTQATAGLSTALAGLEQADLGIKNAEEAVRQAQIGYDLTKANYDMSYEQYLFSLDNLEKYEKLYNEGIVSEAEYEQIKLQASDSTLELLEKQLEQAEQGISQANLGIENARVSAKQADAGYTQALDGYESAMDALDDMTFEAPINGYITSVNIVQDGFASNAQAAVTIEYMDVIMVNISVTENIVNKILKGENVEVFIDSIGDKVFNGMISTISPASDSRTLLYAATIEIENSTNEIKPGMFADVKLKIEEKNNTFYVKGNAVFNREGKTYVYIVKEDNTPELREVEIGLDTGDYMEIIKGISEDEIYITKGMGFINKETLIKVVRGDN